MLQDWDNAYANQAYIHQAEHYMQSWPKRSDEFRQSWSQKILDLSYGSGERQRFDVFLPTENTVGLLVFVHGGYWMALDKSIWSYLAAGALQHGWAVAMPSYTLAPQASIAAITEEIRQALLTMAAQIPEVPISLCGHSAGGHLVSRMLCQDITLPTSWRQRLHRVTSISGVHDLRPLLRTRLNQTLGLDENSANNNSATTSSCRVL